MKKLYILIPLILSMAEPLKDKGLKIELEDKKGVKHHLNGLVCGGWTYLKVKEGNLEYSLDLSTLKSVEVLSQEGDQLMIRIQLKNGGTEEYTLPANTYCKAKSNVGEAGFYLRDIKTIFIKMEDGRL
ncbi:MAG: hypothetical protein ACK4LT_02285 [Aquificaceae bacterium]